MLIFQEGDAPDIGPVRSGRPYFVYWAAEYRAGFAHYGGDEKTRFRVIPAATGKIMYDLDALAGSAGAFHRISSRDAPHNAYTSTADLWKMTARKKYPATMVAGARDAPVRRRRAGIGAAGEGLDLGPVRPRRHRLHVRPGDEQLPPVGRRKGPEGRGRRQARDRPQRRRPLDGPLDRPGVGGRPPAAGPRPDRQGHGLGLPRRQGHQGHLAEEGPGRPRRASSTRRATRSASSAAGSSSRSSRPARR